MYHKGMLFNRKFGRIGLFALPTFWLFEYWGPIIELGGYLFVTLLLVIQLVLGLHFLNEAYAVAFFLASLGYGILVNLFAVLVGAWRFRFGLADRLQRGLLPFSRRRDVLILLVYAVLENLPFSFRHGRCTGGCAACGTPGAARRRGRSSPGSASGPNPERPWLKRAAPRVLIVDDDPAIAQLLTHILGAAAAFRPAGGRHRPRGPPRNRRWTSSCWTTSCPDTTGTRAA